MGQQQLLLIVLGVILVGVAVVLGIQYFSVGAEQGAKDELVAHCQIIGANAQEWYKKPVGMGGGGNSFALYKAEFDANQVGLHTSTNGTYTVPAQGTLNAVSIEGHITNTSLGYGWHVQCDVTPTGITTYIKTGA